MNEEQREPKISGVEAFIMIMLCVLFDIAGIIATLLDVVFGAGEFIKFFIGIVASAIIFFWAIMKGVRTTWIAVGGILELVPFLNTLPIYTITMATVIYLDHYPKQAGIVHIVSPRVVNPKKIPQISKQSPTKTITAS